MDDWLHATAAHMNTYTKQLSFYFIFLPLIDTFLSSILPSYFFLLELALVDFMKDGRLGELAVVVLCPRLPLEELRFPVLLRSEELRSLEPLRFLSMMILSCRLKMPWFFLHLK